MVQPAMKETATHYTYGDYLHWPGEIRCELIDGVIYDMSPAPTVRHQEVLVELVAQAQAALRDGPCQVLVAPLDVRLPHEDEADEVIDTVVRPDLVVVCDESKLDRHGCRGAPDWVVEILSPSTSAKDQVAKRKLYERSGVREYWIVHPEEGVLTVYLLDDQGRYPVSRTYETKGASEVAVLPGLSIEWGRLFPEPEPAEPPPFQPTRKEEMDDFFAEGREDPLPEEREPF